MPEAPSQNSHKSESSADARLARILLPVAILREVDEIVLAGTGGFRTRQEFFAEAIQNLILEVKHGMTPDGQLVISSNLADSEVGNHAYGAVPAVRPDAPASEAESPPKLALDSPMTASTLSAIKDLRETALPAVAPGAPIRDGIGAVKREPTIGLHNRDYPSLWAGIRLGSMTQHGPVPVQEFLHAVTGEAWEFGTVLLPLERQTKIKLTALFPTNLAKPQSAEASFHTFAVGDIARRPNDDGTVNVAEGLFAWEAAQVVREDGRLCLGLTEKGYELLGRMEGLTLSWPHDSEHARAFIDYLKVNAPWDWGGFATLLDAAGDQPNRAALVQQFNQWHPEWSDAVEHERRRVRRPRAGMGTAGGEANRRPLSPHRVWSGHPQGGRST